MTIGNLGEYDLTQISAVNKKRHGLLKEMDKSFEAVLAEVVAGPDAEDTMTIQDGMKPMGPPRAGQGKLPTAEDMLKLIEDGAASGVLTETEVTEAKAVQEQIATLMNSDDFKAIQTAMANKESLTDDQKELMAQLHTLMKSFSEYAHKVMPAPPDMSSVQDRMMKKLLRELMKMPRSDIASTVDEAEEEEETDVDNTVTAVDDTETTETADTTDTTTSTSTDTTRST